MKIATCKSCGIHIPEGQKDICSMCYGDIAWGNDGYYEDWARDLQDQDWDEHELYHKDYDGE